jgi:translation initiation factor IF-3
MGDYGKISLIPLTGIVFVLSYSDRIRRRKLAISNKDEYRINKQIRATQIRLIDEDGENIGVVSLREGLTRAEDAGLDLVEVAPNADPPVDLREIAEELSDVSEVEQAPKLEGRSMFMMLAPNK